MGAPSQIVEPIPPMVSAFTRGWGFVDEGVAGSPPTSNSWAGANWCRYVPIYVPSVTVAARMWWANGGSVAGNVETAIYRDTGEHKPGALLVASGSTAQSGTTAVQFADITDTRLDPGLWWLYIACDSASATFMASGISSAFWRELAMFYQISGISLGSPPDPASPVETTVNVIYLYGFSTNTVT